MAMGKRKRDRQPTMWVATTDFPTAASHPFYTRLNQLLREHAFDDFAEAQCARFYADPMGRPGLPPGIYFRLLLTGYFEGIDSERGIAWRAADSFALRDFLSVGLKQAPPDHSTISRTRRLIDHLPKIGQRAKQVVWNQLLTPLRADVIDELRWYFQQARTHAAPSRCDDLDERFFHARDAFSA